MRILYAEDSPEYAKLVLNILRELPRVTEVNHAKDGKEATRMFGQAKSDAFDLIITDYQMPHRSGEELAAHIRDLQYSKPIFLLTGDRSQVKDHTLFTRIFCKDQVDLLTETIINL